jgi:Tfp pilus assembly protein PilF
VSAPEAHRITGAIAQPRSDTLAGYPPSTIVVARAGLLLQERLYADARREILAGLAADPAAATLRQLLGLVYERSGLGDLAVQEYEEATMLSTPRS